MKTIITFITIMLSVSINIFAQQDKPAIPKGTIIPKTLDEKKQIDETKLNVIFRDDFESNSFQWKIKGNWEKGKLNSASLKKSLRGNSFTTGLDKTYKVNSDYQLTSPVISLKKIKHNSRIFLIFDETYEIESGYDKGYIKISKDGGNSWIIIGKRDGKSDWVHSIIDISNYKNNNIQIRFELISDDKNNFKGWTVDNIKVGVYDTQNLGVSITSLSSQRFPNIYLNVAVEENGIGLNNLNYNNFTIYENGVLQTCNFEVIPPDLNGQVRLTDIVFIMDNSGSMAEEQTAVNNNVISFVDALVARGVNFNLGLCRFGQYDNSGNPIIEDYGNLTADAYYFKNYVWQRNVVGGGREPGYYAITQSAKNFNFRPGAQKIFIIITDETPDQGGSTQYEAKRILIDNTITLFALTESQYFYEFSPLTSATHGNYYDIYSPFDQILNYITQQVANTYVISYCSSNPNIDAIQRNVRAEVNYNGQTSYDISSYIPHSAPRIMLTSKTIALKNKGQTEYNQLDIRAEVFDIVSPYLQDVTLYYKNTNDATFNSVYMTKEEGVIYKATIPSNYVVSPGIDYYITASDGGLISTLPATSPANHPYQIAVLPNDPPKIEHIRVTTSKPNTTININANVSDNTNYLSEVKLLYRKAGHLLYYEKDMYNTNNDNYQTDIPADFVTKKGIEYCIKAKDDLGVISYFGTIDKPFKIFVTEDDTTVWKNINVNVSKSLRSIYFHDLNTGWAAGSGGKILKTTDGGNTWNKYTYGSSNGIHAIYFINENVGWIVGDHGLFRKSTDGGITWFTLNSPTNVKLRDFAFVNENTGWVVGDDGKIFKTVDGGVNWTAQNSYTNEKLYSVNFINSSLGFISGNHLILRTKDGGNNWVKVRTNKDEELNDIMFVNENIGWAVGRNWDPYDYKGVILKTTDGGDNWIIQPGGLYANTLWSVYFTDENNGWASGNSGTFLRTIDGGINWEKQEVNTNVAQFSVYFLNQYNGWAVGAYGSLLKYKIDNAFISLVNLISPTENATIDNGCITSSENMVWDFDWEDIPKATKYGIYVKSQNATIPIINSQVTKSELHFSDIGYIADQNRMGWKWKVRAFVFGAWGPWSQERSFNVEPVNTDCPYTISLLSPSDGAVMDNGCSDQSNPTVWDFDWDDVPNAKKYNLFVIRQNTSIPLIDVQVDTSAFHFEDPFYINNLLLEGWTWKVRALVDTSWGNWSTTQNFSVEPLNTDCQVGIDDELTLMPKNFVVYQNNPNPFNPTTQIKFGIPLLETLHATSQRVQLKVYDILGNEVTTLVNEEKQPGYYTVTFDASGLASGIYFYRLTAGKFIQTKKMILMR